ncbi:Hypothetical protein FKW44_001867, partial [Caligus rogercresseyi]
MWDGVLPGRIAFLEIELVNPWLTMANILIRFWVSKHRLNGEISLRICDTLEFTFSWIEVPRHILFLLDCLKSKRKEVLDIAMLTVEISTRYAHNEALIQTL